VAPQNVRNFFGRSCRKQDTSAKSPLATGGAEFLTAERSRSPYQGKMR